MSVILTRDLGRPAGRGQARTTMSGQTTARVRWDAEATSLAAPFTECDPPARSGRAIRP